MRSLPPPHRSAARRHLRWIIPLVAGVLGYVGFVSAGSALMSASGGPDGNLGLSLGALDDGRHCSVGRETVRPGPLSAPVNLIAFVVCMTFE